MRHTDQSSTAHLNTKKGRLSINLRQQTVNKTLEYLGTVYEKTLELNTSHPWTIKRIEKLLKKINDTIEWYADKIKQQSERALNVDPLIYVQHLTYVEFRAN